jgi:hypothetical protein
MKFNRVVSVSITPKKTLTEFSVKNLRVKFDVSKTLDIAPNSATITIYNLNPEHRKALLYKYNLFNNNQGKDEISGGKIKLSAGYETEQESDRVIFDGDIVSALTVRDGGDYITTVTAKTFAETMSQGNIAKTYPAKMGDKTVVEKVLEDLNFPGIKKEFLGYWNDIMTAFQANPQDSKEQSFFGSAMAVVEKINKKFQGLFSLNVDENGLNIHGKGVPNKADAGGQPLPRYFYSKYTGMIGSPRTNNKGIDLTVLLEPAIKVSDPVQIESDGLGDEKPVVVVTAINHSGDSIDGQFTTDLTNFYAVNINQIIQGLG